MKAAAVGAVLAVLLVLAVLAALSFGPLGVSPGELARAAIGDGSPRAALALSLRVPRVITALLVGGSLAGAGAAFQTIFRNPLVAPDLLGVSSGAGLGAAGALLAGAAPVLVQGAAFAGGLAAAVLALGCASLARTADPRLSLVLCGIVTGALASAGLALAVFVAEPYTQLPTLTYWLLGSFSRALLPEVLLAGVPAFAGLIALLWLGFRLDVLSLGDEQARALGLPAWPLRWTAIAAATLATSAAVSVCGIVGWIGLLAPHAARQIVGSRANRLLPASIVAGALFALGIDRLSVAFGGAEVPVGLLAAAVGAPLFLILFVATARAPA